MSLDRFRRDVQLAAEEDLIPDVAPALVFPKVGVVKPLLHARHMTAPEAPE